MLVHSQNPPHSSKWRQNYMQNLVLGILCKLDPSNDEFNSVEICSIQTAMTSLKNQVSSTGGMPAGIFSEYTRPQ